MAKSSAAPAHTPTPWEVKFIPEMKQFFIAALPTEDHAYNGKTRFIEVMSDEEYPRKLADANFIVSSCNAHQALYEALSAAIRFNSHKSWCSAEDAIAPCACGATKAMLAATAALALADAAQEGEANERR